MLKYQQKCRDGLLFIRIYSVGREDILDNGGLDKEPPSPPTICRHKLVREAGAGGLAGSQRNISSEWTVCTPTSGFLPNSRLSRTWMVIGGVYNSSLGSICNTTTPILSHLVNKCEDDGDDVFSAHLTLLERALAIDICPSVRQSNAWIVTSCCVDHL